MAPEVNAGSAISPASPTLEGGYVYAREKDPVGLVVNSVNVTTIYYTNGSCDSGGERRYKTTFAGETGWFETDGNWHQGVSCNESYSSRYSRFVNDIFPACTGTTLVLEYNRTAIFGRPNGTLERSWPLYGNGVPCEALLEYKGYLTRTHP